MPASTCWVKPGNNLSLGLEWGCCSVVLAGTVYGSGILWSWVVGIVQSSLWSLLMLPAWVNLPNLACPGVPSVSWPLKRILTTKGYMEWLTSWKQPYCSRKELDSDIGARMTSCWQDIGCPWNQGNPVGRSIWTTSSPKGGFHTEVAPLPPEFWMTLWVITTMIKRILDTN